MSVASSPYQDWTAGTYHARFQPPIHGEPEHAAMDESARDPHPLKKVAAFCSEDGEEVEFLENGDEPKGLTDPEEEDDLGEEEGVKEEEEEEGTHTDANTDNEGNGGAEEAGDSQEGNDAKEDDGTEESGVSTETKKKKKKYKYRPSFKPLKNKIKETEAAFLEESLDLGIVDRMTGAVYDAMVFANLAADAEKDLSGDLSGELSGDISGETTSGAYLSSSLEASTSDGVEDSTEDTLDIIRGIEESPGYGALDTAEEVLEEGEEVEATGLSSLFACGTNFDLNSSDGTDLTLSEAAPLPAPSPITKPVFVVSSKNIKKKQKKNMMQKSSNTELTLSEACHLQTPASTSEPVLVAGNNNIKKKKKKKILQIIKGRSRRSDKDKKKSRAIGEGSDFSTPLPQTTDRTGKGIRETLTTVPKREMYDSDLIRRSASLGGDAASGVALATRTGCLMPDADVDAFLLRSRSTRSTGHGDHHDPAVWEGKANLSIASDAAFEVEAGISKGISANSPDTSVEVSGDVSTDSDTSDDHRHPSVLEEKANVSIASDAAFEVEAGICKRLSANSPDTSAEVSGDVSTDSDTSAEAPSSFHDQKIESRLPSAWDEMGLPIVDTDAIQAKAVPTAAHLYVQAANLYHQSVQNGTPKNGDGLEMQHLSSKPLVVVGDIMLEFEEAVRVKHSSTNSFPKASEHLDDLIDLVGPITALLKRAFKDELPLKLLDEDLASSLLVRCCEREEMLIQFLLEKALANDAALEQAKAACTDLSFEKIINISASEAAGNSFRDGFTPQKPQTAHDLASPNTQTTSEGYSLGSPEVDSLGNASRNGFVVDGAIQSEPDAYLPSSFFQEEEEEGILPNSFFAEEDSVVGKAQQEEEQNIESSVSKVPLQTLKGSAEAVAQMGKTKDSVRGIKKPASAGLRSQAAQTETSTERRRPSYGRLARNLFDKEKEAARIPTLKPIHSSKWSFQSKSTEVTKVKNARFTESDKVDQTVIGKRSVRALSAKFEATKKSERRSSLHCQ